MKTPKKVEDYVRKHWNDMTNVDIANELGISRNTVIRISKRIKLPAKPKLNVVIHDTSLKEELKKFLLKNTAHISVEKLTDKFDIGASKIRAVIEELKNEGFNISVDEAGLALNTTSIGKRPPTVIPTQAGVWHKFGYTTDNHLGSNYERLDVLNALYERFKKEGITTVYNTGNMIDGEARFNKFDIHKHGMESQCRYFAEVFPSVKGLTTYFITGDDHEGWYTQREGIEIGRFLEIKAKEAGRDDLVYLGHMEHDIVLKAKKGHQILRLVHPGGGSSYALSYTPQKLIESYTGGEKPAMLLMGHYHKAEFIYYRGVYCFQGGCTMDQSPFMRKKRLAAHVGGWIIEYQQSEDGTILSVRSEWIPYYDKALYDKKWSYKTSY